MIHALRPRYAALLSLALLLGAVAAPAPHAQGTIEGRVCATPEPTAAQQQETGAAIEAWRQTNGPESGGGIVNVPVAFHVVRSGTSTSQGNVTDQQIADQIQILNDAFLPMGYQFVLAVTTRTTNATWYNGCYGSQELTMKAALNIEPRRFLNVYTCNPSSGILGYATFPSSYPENDYRHGTVLLHSSLPGGTAFPYNEGDTGTHEVGHWVGLYHTFQGGCATDDPPGCETSGDWVCDTPSEASPAFGCPLGRNTCASGGPDPVENFMDYTDDDCMNHFTDGQGARAVALMEIYRPTISSNPLAFASPEDADFGDINVGESATEPVVLVNLSDQPLEVTSITSDNPAFTASIASTTVPALSGESFDVTFTPVFGLPETGTLTIETTNPEVGTLTVALSGSGVPPVASLPVAGIAAEANVGEDVVVPFTIANVEGGTLTYSFEDLPSWITDITPMSGSVAPGASEEVQVTLSAAGLAVGVEQSLLRLVTNDPGLDEVDLHVVFAVGGAFPPPVLLSPLYGDDEVPTDYVLAWLAVDEAAAYDIQVATDDAFTDLVEEATVTDTEVGFLADAGVTLYWRVRSIDAASAESAWSLPFVFSTATTVANEPDAAPTRVTLGAAYPNPAFGDVTVPFVLDEPRAVRLHVFDVTGRLVGALADGAGFPAGSHALRWSPGTLPAGVYLVRLVAGDETATSRVVVTR